MTEPTALAGFVSDPRVALCEVEVCEGVLVGSAASALRDKLSAYADTHGLRLEVAFSSPSARHLVGSRTPLFKYPTARSDTVSEVGFGERLHAFGVRDGFVHVAAQRDGYLGWVPAELLGALPEPTHRLKNLRAHVYDGPDVSARRVLELSYAAPLRALGEADGWTEISLAEGTGYVRSRALEPFETRLKASPETITDFALRFLETPYLWGGVSAWGLDCSGLVQTVYRAFGISLPRDSDQQAECGEALSVSAVRAADLLFFPGHVAIALGGDRFLHANAQHMCVSVDSFSDDGYGRRLRDKVTRVVRVLP